MDLLSDILSTLNLKGMLYFRTEFSGKWAVTVPTLAEAARFHLVIKGRCHVRISEDRFQTLNAGDIILVPKGRSHILSDSPQKTAPPLEKVISQSGYDGQGLLVYGNNLFGLSTQMVCGHFSFRPGADHPLLRNLPDFITISSVERKKMPLLDESLRLIVNRAFSEELGSTSGVTKLSEIVFMEILQSAITGNSQLTNVLEALRDEKISRALRLIHTNLDRQWTVESLAREVAMSRSRFSDRFLRLVGESPISYLNQWRFQKSLELLDGTDCPIQRIALETGYKSPASFSRAFHDKCGMSPREYRLQSGL